MSDRPKFRLLFVCTGNTCRSPIAQVLAERLLGRRGWNNVEVRSAGVSAAVGGGASEGARAAAEADGLSLAGHNGTQLDRDLVASVDLILTMGAHHADAAEALGGDGKVWTVSAFAEGGEQTRGPGVPDPFGGDARIYRDCLDALQPLVEAAIIRIGAEFLGQNAEPLVRGDDSSGRVGEPADRKEADNP
jgi:protein-tyrosine-phosphatase